MDANTLTYEKLLQMERNFHMMERYSGGEIILMPDYPPYKIEHVPATRIFSRKLPERYLCGANAYRDMMGFIGV